MSPASAPSKFTVAILPLGDVSTEQIELTEIVLQQEFLVNTLVLPAKEIPPQYFNNERNRYQSHNLLNFLFFQLPTNAQRIIGVIEGDMENKERKPCFGRAQLHHRVAIYTAPNPSKPRYYTLPSRHLIIHELSHTFGLGHCEAQSSGCALDARRPSIVLCARCQKWVNRELRVRPGSAEERFSLAESFFIYNCLPQAVATYREAIALSPREPLYYHCLSAALFKLKQFEEGELTLVSASAHSNDYPNFYYTNGLNYLRKEPEKALEYFAKSIAVAENPQKIQRLIGNAYRMIRHDVDCSARHYKEYLQLGGDDMDIVDWLISRSRLDQA